MLVVVSADVLRAREVTTNTILGSVCVYLLLALAWAVSYVLLQAFDGNAFSLPASDAARTQRGHLVGDMSTFVYYSFVTLTTMGYGDILPVSHTARGLATCEAVVGQIYLTVLVALAKPLGGFDLQNARECSGAP